MPYKDKNKRSEYTRNRYKNDTAFREKVLATSHRNYSTEKKRRQHLKRAYGITLEDYNEMLTKQNGVCAICRNPPVPVYHFKYLQVDHCHRTGRVRGLLCFQCNLQLGWFETKRATVEDYIKEPQ